MVHVLCKLPLDPKSHPHGQLLTVKQYGSFLTLAILQINKLLPIFVSRLALGRIRRVFGGADVGSRGTTILVELLGLAGSSTAASLLMSAEHRERFHMYVRRVSAACTGVSL